MVRLGSARLVSRWTGSVLVGLLVPSVLTLVSAIRLDLFGLLYAVISLRTGGEGQTGLGWRWFEGKGHVY